MFWNLARITLETSVGAAYIYTRNKQSNSTLFINIVFKTD